MITLKRVRVSLTIAVLIVGGLLVIGGPISAETSQDYQSMDRTLEMTECENSDTTVFCYYAYCLEEGADCSFWAGACFSFWGGYCEGGILE